MSSPTPLLRLLLIEDDDAIAEALTDGLGRHGCTVVRAVHAAEALGHFSRAVKGASSGQNFDLVLLDLGLPDLDGVEVCRAIRQTSTIPIMIVSARGDELDRVLGLEAGADDYIVKPFGLQEIVARVRALARRSRLSGQVPLDGHVWKVRPSEGPSGPEQCGENQEAIRVGRLVIDRRRRTVTLGGTPIILTAKEYGLLVALAVDCGALVSRRTLLLTVWDQEYVGSSKTLDVHVSSLRRKLGDHGWVETVRGEGFRLRQE